MQTLNNYDRDVYNGDIGYVTHIDHENQELAVSFEGRPVKYAFGELDEIVLCYATSIHKSQKGVSGRRDPPVDAALHDAQAEPRLHRHHAR